MTHRRALPRRERVTVSTGAPWEAVFGYSRAVAVTGRGAHVVVAGTTATVNGVVQHRGDTYRQTLAAIDIIAGALGQVGGGLEHVIRTRLFVAGREHLYAAGRAHGERFGSIRPASSIVVVSGFIDEAMLVEIEAEAFVPEGLR
jgi:enamine deaminase RidA (YjgF/YER057c/UK114 family)